MPLPNISLNPKLSAVIDLTLNIMALLLITKLSSWLWFLILFFSRQLLWLILTGFTYYPKTALRVKHYLSLLVFSLGMYLTIVFTDWPVALYILMTAFLILSFISFWFLPQSKIQFNIFLKPYTRWRFLISSLGLAGILIGIQSIVFYQVLFTVNHWLWHILTACVSSLMAFWWWYEYGIKLEKRIFIASAAFFILMIELAWIITALPIGNIASGLILTWSWYLIWLLNRFNLTAEGIKWLKQTKFLLANLAIFALFLIFIVRWR